MSKPAQMLFGILVMSGVFAGSTTETFARQDRGFVSVPACFIEDTVYHMVLDLEHKELRAWYGAWALVSCSFTSRSDADELSGFFEQWRISGRTPWQTVKRRGIWSGQSAVSDTVIAVVSRVAKADPELIKRVSPDRFRVDLTGGFSLLVQTPKGASQKKGLAETWNDITSRVRAFGRLQSLTLVVSPEDAQTLYYALEPGTPVLLSAHAPAP
jgi:hypothetical protein